MNVNAAYRRTLMLRGCSLHRRSNLRSFATNEPYEGLKISLDEATGVQTLRINRPQRLNAINYKLYAAIPAALTEAADDPKVKITVLTGTGRYFSSGNDLADFASKW